MAVIVGRVAAEKSADAIEAALAPPSKRLEGLHALVTAGPTREPLDPVRYISNHSSGKQGYAIAAALAAEGARVTLVSGPVALKAPDGVTFVSVETAREIGGAESSTTSANDALRSSTSAHHAALPASGGRTTHRTSLRST